MLRRALLLLAIAGAAGTTAGAIAAPSDVGNGNGNGPPQDMVVGSAKIFFGPEFGGPVTEQYIVSAHSGPAGDDPEGQITVHSPLLESAQAKADVECMVVSGNHARVGGVFEPAIQYAGFRIRHWEVIIDDNGSPGQAPDAANAFAFLDRPRPPGFSPCNFEAPTVPVEEGNYNVNDASTGRIVP